MLTRLAKIAAAGILSGFASLWAADSACETAVVFRSGSSAYEDALRGIRETLPNSACRVQYVDLQDPAAAKSMDAVLAASPKLVVTVGVGSYAQVHGAHPTLTILPAVVLRAELPAASKRVGAVYADVPLPVILERLHALFPKRTRIGLIRRPSSPALDPAVRERARQLGFDLRIVECAGPEKLLAAFSSLKSTADFVIADPDAELYNSATIKPLVLASLDERLPIAGFSAAFVHAGALLAVYPDFHELGRQTGELATALLQGKTAGVEEDVHKVKVAVNQQIARLLGIDPAQQDDVEVFK